MPEKITSPINGKAVSGATVVPLRLITEKISNSHGNREKDRPEPGVYAASHPIIGRAGNSFEETLRIPDAKRRETPSFSRDFERIRYI